MSIGINHIEGMVYYAKEEDGDYVRDDKGNPIPIREGIDDKGGKYSDKEKEYVGVYGYRDVLKLYAYKGEDGKVHVEGVMIGGYQAKWYQNEEDYEEKGSLEYPTHEGFYPLVLGRSSKGYTLAMDEDYSLKRGANGEWVWEERSSGEKEFAVFVHPCGVTCSHAEGCETFPGYDPDVDWMNDFIVKNVRGKSFEEKIRNYEDTLVKFVYSDDGEAYEKAQEIYNRIKRDLLNNPAFSNPEKTPYFSIVINQVDNLDIWVEGDYLYYNKGEKEIEKEIDWKL